MRMAKRKTAAAADGELVISEKFRTTPIKSTITKVKGLHSSAIIYKCPASSYWQFRAFLEGKRRKCTTKETEIDRALRKAKLIYSEWLNSINNGESKVEPTSRKSLDVVARSLWAKNETRIKNGELHKDKVTKDKYVYERHIRPYFLKHDIKDIDADLLEQFKGHLAKNDLSAGSQTSYMQVVMALLSEAQKKKMIANIPPKPRVRIDDGVRGYFNEDEYNELIGFFYDSIGKPFSLKKKDGTVYRKIKITGELQLLIEFMVNTYIRPTDIKVLRHRDVHIVKRGDIKFITLRHEPTKRHKKQMTSTEKGYGIYLQIKAYHDLKGNAADDDYVFMPTYSNRDTALDNLATQFTMLLEDCKLRTDKDGKPRTLYSLRHTAIVQSIQKGLSLELIASNSRTSTDMIRRFYGSHIDSVLDMGDEYYNAEALVRDHKNKKIEQMSNIAGVKVPTISERERRLHEIAIGTASMLREYEEAGYIETDDEVQEQTAEYENDKEYD